MTRPSQLGLWLVAVIALVFAALSAWSAHSASVDSERARVRAASLARNLAEIDSLRAQKQTALLDSPPTESLSAAVRSSLKSAGIPDSTLRSLSSAPDESISAPGLDGYRRLSVSLQLTPITNKQLGQFLADWRQAEPAWLVTRIDLSHSAPESDVNCTYEARLTLATTFVRPAPDKHSLATPATPLQ